MKDYIRLNESNCKNCYKCLRRCPVKSINFQSGKADIIRDECIFCGECYVTCPQNAKSIRNDISAAKALLDSRLPVYASVAPAFAANYEGLSFDSLKEALMKLGFTGAEETAIGATIVKNRYNGMINEGKQDVIISSCCHSINLLIQKDYPEALQYLAPVVSPMLAHSNLLKANNPGARTVFIGPCISKKAEAEAYPGSVDCVLTFGELRSWLDESGISINMNKNSEPAGKAALFPLTGGILRVMQPEGENYKYIAIDGTGRCKEALEEICNGKSFDKCFIEMSACRGSCINGPAMEKRAAPISRFVYVSGRVKEDDFVTDMPPDKTLVKEIKYSGVRVAKPGGEAITEQLRKMGKTKPSDELNCGSCGYSTCRDKAAAIIEGKAHTSMCLPYLMEKTKSFSDTVIINSTNGVIVLDETLEIQQINAAARSIMNIHDERDVLGRNVVCVLEPDLFSRVVTTHANVYEKQAYLAEYGRYVVLTIIYDPGYHVLICTMRDVTETEKGKAARKEISRKTVDITEMVIEKQMRAVQEIASLLGETTAETKVALTKLKETLTHE